MNQIGYISPNDLKYLSHIVDQSHLVNGTPVTFKRVTESSRDYKDDLFDEVLPSHKQWEETQLTCIVVNRPTKEILDRFGTDHSITLLVTISYLETQRKQWTLSPQDIIRYPNMEGTLSDFYIEHLLHDGEFRDTDGNQHPVSYTILLTDHKAPTR